MTEPPGGAFQAGKRLAKTGIAYSASLASLTDPGSTRSFFNHAPQSLEALAAEACHLAYVNFESERKLLTKSLSKVGFSLTREPYDDGNTQAYIAHSEHLRLLVFRGSDDLKAWQTNVKGRPVSWLGLGSVHEGFADALEIAWPTLCSQVAGPDALPLLIAGHSLGGALATLAAALLPEALLYSFGAPRVGNQAFVHAMRPAEVRHHRYVNHRDPVPLLPPGLLGYQHSGRAYYIDKQGAVRAMLHLKRRKIFRDMRHVLNRVVGALNNPKEIPLRDLTDHAPINYVSALR